MKYSHLSRKKVCAAFEALDQEVQETDREGKHNVWSAEMTL